jgi:hypothetical protein
LTRAEILKAAERCVCTDRNQQYGEPEDNFRTISMLWSVYLCARGLDGRYIVTTGCTVMEAPSLAEAMRIIAEYEHTGS